MYQPISEPVEFYVSKMYSQTNEWVVKALMALHKNMKN